MSSYSGGQVNFLFFFVFLGGLCVCCNLASDIPDEIRYSIYFLHKGKINLLSYAVLWRRSCCWKSHRMPCKTNDCQSLQTINYCGWCLKTAAAFICEVDFAAVAFLPDTDASNQWPHEWLLICPLFLARLSGMLSTNINEICGSLQVCCIYAIRHLYGK